MSPAQGRPVRPSNHMAAGIAYAAIEQSLAQRQCAPRLTRACANNAHADAALACGSDGAEAARLPGSERRCACCASPAPLRPVSSAAAPVSSLRWPTLASYQRWEQLSSIGPQVGAKARMSQFVRRAAPPEPPDAATVASVRAAQNLSAHIAAVCRKQQPPGRSQRAHGPALVARNAPVKGAQTPPPSDPISTRATRAPSARSAPRPAPVRDAQTPPPAQTPPQSEPKCTSQPSRRAAPCAREGRPDSATVLSARLSPAKPLVTHRRPRIASSGASRGINLAVAALTERKRR